MFSFVLFRFGLFNFWLWWICYMWRGDYGMEGEFSRFFDLFLCFLGEG